MSPMVAPPRCTVGNVCHVDQHYATQLGLPKNLTPRLRPTRQDGACGFTGRGNSFVRCDTTSRFDALLNAARFVYSRPTLPKRPKCPPWLRVTPSFSEPGRVCSNYGFTGFSCRGERSRYRAG